MNKEEYQKLVQKYTPTEDKLKNALKAFVVGGLVGVLSIIIYKILLSFNITEKDANIWTILILILVSSICTGLNFFDDWVSKARCGLSVPITGFSNSVVSPALEFKAEGYVLGVGAKLFTIAGPVIVYGVSASVVYGLIYYFCQFVL